MAKCEVNGSLLQSVPTVKNILYKRGRPVSKICHPMLIQLPRALQSLDCCFSCILCLLIHSHGSLAGPWLGANSISKIPTPSKIFVLSYKNILIKEIFHFEASYYGSQHPPLRTSCDTYCSTGLTGNKHKLLGNWSFSAPRAQNWASKVSKTIY